jgi:hypothetical protein
VDAGGTLATAPQLLVEFLVMAARTVLLAGRDACPGAVANAGPDAKIQGKRCFTMRRLPLALQTEPTEQRLRKRITLDEFLTHRLVPPLGIRLSLEDMGRAI